MLEDAVHWIDERIQSPNKGHICRVSLFVTAQLKLYSLNKEKCPDEYKFIRARKDV